MGKNEIEVNQFDNLTEQQKLFCEVYIKNGNATKSCELAGYSKKGLAAAGSRLLKNPKIVEYINYLRKEMAFADTVKPEHVVSWVGDLANPANGASQATQLKANELLMKYFGLLIEKREVTNETNINIHDPSMLSESELNKLLKEYEKELPILEATYEEIEKE